MNDCEYCKHHSTPSEVIWDTHNLKTYKVDNNYIKMDLENRVNEGRLICEICIDDKVSKLTIDINHCPMCGRKLGE